MTTPTTDVITDPQRRHDFALLFDVTNGNPNGDPDAGGDPRVDAETMHGLVTSIEVRRVVLGFVAAREGRVVGDGEWTLHRFGGPGPEARWASGILADWNGLEARERALDVREGQPFLLPPDGIPDIDVLAYFYDPSFTNLAPNSQLSYAYDLRVYLSFWVERGDWRDATERDIGAYEFWRRTHKKNPQRVGGAKFARDLASIRRFYAWQEYRGVVQRNPVGPRRVRRNAPRVRMKWLKDDEYLTWRNVGLLGTGAQSSRIRNRARNMAFADAMWSSGLRLEEAGTLLVYELPHDGGAPVSFGRLSGATSKSVGRDFCMTRNALQRIRTYRESGRDGTIRRAQAAGRYDRVPGARVVKTVTQHRHLVYREQNGSQGSVPIDELTADERARIYIEGDDGLEPAMLWLTRDGMPMPFNTWQKVFEAANARCTAAGAGVRCYPHMLRHTFAMRWLVLLQDAYRREYDLAKHERRLLEHILGDPFVMVQHLLGHATVETTKKYYLEPAQGVALHHMMNTQEEEFSPIDVYESVLSWHRTSRGAVQ